MAIETSKRKSHGNVFFLTLLLALLGIALFLSGFTIYSVMLTHRLLASRMQETTAAAASILNANDCGGQIDNMTAASRQLLYDSRLNFNQAAENYPEILPLAETLVNESRDGCNLVSTERQNVIDGVVFNLRQFLLKTETETSSTSGQIFLPWLMPGKICLDSCSIGNLTGDTSNVAAPFGNEPLAAIDTSVINKLTGCYASNLNLQLPSPDSELSFRISAFAPPVAGTVAPLRCLNGEHFKPCTTLVEDAHALPVSRIGFFPSTIQIKTHQTIVTTLPVRTEQTFLDTETATTYGASPMP